MTLLAIAFASANAEQMYIIDKVVVNVYVEPNQETRKVALLQTGDRVDVVDKLEGYVRVRLPDGREGWMRANYLSTEAPAIIQLKELQRAQPASQPQVQQPAAPPPQLVEEIANLKKQNAVLQGELTTLRQQAATPAPPPSMASAAVTTAVPAQPQKVAAPVVPRSDIQPVARSNVWLWSGISVLTAVVGFVLGYQALALRIRRKYGNVRIY